MNKEIDMNYYIQGNPTKAEQIKAAFEKLGYEKVNVIHIGDYANERLFFFTENGKVMSILKDCGIVNIIKTHPDYKELELPVEPKFKVGDWITSIDDEGDAAVERIVNLRDNKVLLVDIDGCFTEYPKGALESYHLWTIADAKNGDVLVTDNGWTCIFKAFDGCTFTSYCFMDSQKWFCEVGAKGQTLNSRINGDIHPATQKQRNLFFKKMQEAGYQWYAGKKELRKIKPHYDISSFQPFDKVLVRDSDDTKWRCNWFSHYSVDGGLYRFVTTKCGYAQCIPFEGNEALLGTTKMPSEEFINW